MAHATTPFGNLTQWSFAPKYKSGSLIDPGFILNTYLSHAVPLLHHEILTIHHQYIKEHMHSIETHPLVLSLISSTYLGQQGMVGNPELSYNQQDGL